MENEPLKQYLEQSTEININKSIWIKLNKPIEENEIEKAINQIKLIKASGPDGISAKFYKILKKELIPVLKVVLNNLLDHGRIPETWNEALISLLPKKGLELCKNYRPISLANDDYKIGTCVLANRLKIFVVEYIDEEHSGFYHCVK